MCEFDGIGGGNLSVVSSLEACAIKEISLNECVLVSHDSTRISAPGPTTRV